MIEQSARETLAADQRSAFDDDFILEHWPLSSAACQIRRERAAAQPRPGTQAARGPHERGVPYRRVEDEMSDLTYGPQDAPQDYRIANRPGNPNWHGVKAWFDEVAKPYHERATVHIPRCPKCDAKDFYVTPEELADAEGVIACEYCDTLINPDNIPAAQVWSTPAQREQWKAEAQQEIAAAAEDMSAAFHEYMQAATESAEEYSQRSEGGWR